MNYLVTMTDPVFDVPTEKILRDAPALGDCKVLCYDAEWFMQHPFWTIPGNRWLLEHPLKRGLFLYSWKPLLILDAMQRFLSMGDVVMYLDADSVPLKPFATLFNECRTAGEGIMLFRASGHKNYQWTKRDMRIVMGLDDEKYHDQSLDAGVARFCLFQKGWYKVDQFLAEWLTYSINPKATTFDPSTLGAEDHGFVEHRMEQAILSALAYKFEIPLRPELDYEPPNYFDQQNPRPAESRQETAPILGSKWRNV